MLIYRVEHAKTQMGPFQSEFYGTGDDYDTLAPHNWGLYLPIGDEVHDSHYQYGNLQRRFGCHNKIHIEAMCEAEAEQLTEAGWLLAIYEVPDHCVFIANSLKQVVFDFAQAIIKLTLDLLEFVKGNEVPYVIPADL